jgi:cytochrome P450
VTAVPSRRRSTPPGPESYFSVNLLRLVARDKLAFFKELARYGDVSQVRFGPRRIALISHPDDIRRILVTEQKKFTKGNALAQTETLLGQGLLTSEGEFHLRQRRMIQPGLHRERLAGYGQVMTDYAERMQTRWTDGQRLDVHEEMMHLTLGIAGRTLFDVDVEHEASEIGEVLDLSLKMFLYAVLPLGTLLEYAPIPWVRRLHYARRRMDELIAGIITRRRREGIDRGDLLSMLIQAQDELGHTGGMTDKQLRDELVTLLLAGHETTANALSWTWYLLSQHPAVEAKLHAELDAVLGDRAPTPADAPRLVYTRMVLAESMRLFPPAWILEREVMEEFEAGGYRFPVGTMIYMSQYLTHRDPRWWPTPTRFDPERWAPELAEGRPKFSYFPFGGGTRICVGEHFAWLEGMLVLASVARRWQLRYDEPHAPVPEPSVTLRPKGGLPVRLERRPGRG